MSHLEVFHWKLDNPVFLKVKFETSNISLTFLLKIVNAPALNRKVQDKSTVNVFLCCLPQVSFCCKNLGRHQEITVDS